MSTKSQSKTKTGKLQSSVDEKKRAGHAIELNPEAERLNRAIRQHWSIENKPHWEPDVSFREEPDRKRAANVAQNFSVINRIALNLLQQDKTTTLGIRGKRLKAGWDNDYLIQLLGQ